MKSLLKCVLLILTVFLMLSCDNSKKETDDLFYQISKSDSTKYMDEILTGFIAQAIDEQEREQEQLNSIHFVSYPICYQRFGYKIYINAKGEVETADRQDTVSIEEIVVRYFSFNRNLTSAEATLVAMDSKSPHFNFPFFNRFGLEEIERKVEETTKEWEEIRRIEDADDALIEFYSQNIEPWKRRRKALIFLGDEELPEIASHARIDLEYRDFSVKVDEVLNEIALAFYQLRNYECFRYFNESYLSLYDRVQRKNRKRDRQKLEVIEILRPIAIHLSDLSKPSSFRYSEPIPQEIIN